MTIAYIAHRVVNKICQFKFDLTVSCFLATKLIFIGYFCFSSECCIMVGMFKIKVRIDITVLGMSFSNISCILYTL